jgi:hypothetical protein
MMLTNAKFELIKYYPDSEGGVGGGGDVALRWYEGRVSLLCERRRI